MSDDFNFKKFIDNGKMWIENKYKLFYRISQVTTPCDIQFIPVDLTSVLKVYSLICDFVLSQEYTSMLVIEEYNRTRQGNLSDTESFLIGICNTAKRIVTLEKADKDTQKKDGKDYRPYNVFSSESFDSDKYTIGLLEAQMKEIEILINQEYLEELEKERSESKKSRIRLVDKLKTLKQLNKDPETNEEEKQKLQKEIKETQFQLKEKPLSPVETKLREIHSLILPRLRRGFADFDIKKVLRLCGVPISQLEEMFGSYKKVIDFIKNCLSFHFGVNNIDYIARLLDQTIRISEKWNLYSEQYVDELQFFQDSIICQKRLEDVLKIKISDFVFFNKSILYIDGIQHNTCEEIKREIQDMFNITSTDISCYAKPEYAIVIIPIPPEEFFKEFKFANVWQMHRRKNWMLRRSILSQIFGTKEIASHSESNLLQLKKIDRTIVSDKLDPIYSFYNDLTHSQEIVEDFLKLKNMSSLVLKYTIEDCQQFYYDEQGVIPIELSDVSDEGLTEEDSERGAESDTTNFQKKLQDCGKSKVLDQIADTDMKAWDEVRGHFVNIDATTQHLPKFLPSKNIKRVKVKSGLQPADTVPRELQSLKGIVNENPEFTSLIYTYKDSSDKTMNHQSYLSISALDKRLDWFSEQTQILSIAEIMSKSFQAIDKREESDTTKLLSRPVDTLYRESLQRDEHYWKEIKNKGDSYKLKRKRSHTDDEMPDNKTYVTEYESDADEGAGSDPPYKNIDETVSVIIYNDEED